MMKNKLLLTPIIVVLITLFIFLNVRANSDLIKIDDEPQIYEREIKTPQKNGLLERNFGIAPLEIEATSAYSIYYKNGKEQILYSKNRHSKLPIASITKLLTALVVYQNYDLNQTVSIPSGQIFTNVNLNSLRIFTNTTFKDLLYPLLLESNNSSAYAAATAYPGISFDQFISLMNKTAIDLNMSRSSFYNPSGLDNFRGVNLSTAVDITSLVKEALEIPIFWEIMKKTNHYIYSPDKTLYYYVKTTNRFLDGSHFRGNNPEWFNRIVGGKTGFTYQAMGCLVMVLKDADGDGYFINVILGANGIPERFEEMEKLINWIHQAYNI